MSKPKFPHIHLKIPEPILVALRWGVLAVFLTANVLAVLPTPAPSVLGAQTQTHEELAYWQQVVRMHPDYKDAFLMIAARAYELGDEGLVRQAVAQVLRLDPNDPTAQTILSSLPSLAPAP